MVNNDVVVHNSEMKLLKFSKSAASSFKHQCFARSKDAIKKCVLIVMFSWCHKRLYDTKHAEVINLAKYCYLVESGMK